MTAFVVVLLLVLLPCSGYATPSSCLQFDGVDDYVVAPSSGLPAGSTDRTIEFWMNSDSYAQQDGTVIASWGVQDVSQFCGLALRTRGAAGQIFFWGYYNDINGNTVLQDAVWYHIAFTLQGNQARLYVNGELDASGALDGLNTASISTFLLAYGRDWNRHFNGSIDEVRVWNRALPAAEINAKMHSRLDAIAETGLVLYWGLDEGTGTTAFDFSGHGNNGQMFGALWVAGVQLDPVQWSPAVGGNGHSYELVRETAPISWLAAKAQAESMGGHLAAITSQAENDWVWAHIVHPNALVWDYQVLLGGHHSRQSPPTTGWSWVTGEPWDYQAWRLGEPNGDLGEGDRGDFLCYASCTVQGWNDTGDTVDQNYYYLVEYNGIDLRLSDVPSDQGGFLQIRWSASTADAAGASDPVASYDAQRFENGAWATLATMVAAQADTYQVAVSTPDIFTIGQATPYSRYRVVASSSDPTKFYLSAVDSAYSIDNLAPPKPSASISEDEEFRAIVCTNPGIPDFGELCVYRGTVADFEPLEHLDCISGRIWVESQLNNYFYRVQYADTHGNLSQFSDELSLQFPSSVGESIPSQFALEQNHPNPFNPSTTIKFSLPNASSVRLGVYDVAGKLVRSLLNGQVIYAGHRKQPWDGRDDDGRQVPAGVYFYKLDAGAHVDVKRMALVK